ncbi:MAG: MFS transporter [Solirubrobacterales bacterium]|nr:MFS transporter [Solirubrobacterales bacterium]
MPRRYGALYALPAIRWQAGAGLLAQVTQGTAGVGIILVLRGHSGSLVLAGVVVAALWIAAAVARPIQGRLIDRRGSPEVMAVCGVIHGAALAGVVGLSSLHAPGWLLVVFGVLAGLALPPVSTSMRVAWAGAVDLHQRTAAYSLVYLVQELAILIGPVIFAGLTAASSASLALLAVVVIAVSGALVFAASARSPGDRRARAPGPRRGVLRAANMQLLVLVAVLIGSMVGGIQVAAPITASARGAPAVAGLLIAAVSVGGIIGAAIYASGRWRTAPTARLLVLLALVTGSLALVIPAESLIVIGGLLMTAGLSLNPALSTLSLVVDQHVCTRSAGEAFGWLSTGIAGGTGGGAAIAATFAQHQHDPRAGFIVAAVAAATATLVVLAARRRLSRTPAVSREGAR